MATNDSENEREANNFDMRLYSLIRIAADRGSNNSTWLDIATELAAIRPNVRKMMSERERERTR